MRKNVISLDQKFYVLVAIGFLFSNACMHQKGMTGAGKPDPVLARVWLDNGVPDPKPRVDPPKIQLHTNRDFAVWISSEKFDLKWKSAPHNPSVPIRPCKYDSNLDIWSCRAGPFTNPTVAGQPLTYQITITRPGEPPYVLDPDIEVLP